MAVALKRIEGKYEILEKLSEGGMGSVYRVRHRLLDEIRAIKVLRPQLKDDPTFAARFLHEARAAVRLKHPNLAEIYDLTTDEGLAFMVMEYIDGATLSALLKNMGPPRISMVLDTGIQALSALGYLHDKGLIHRDVAPDNLMLTLDSEGRPRVKLIDLGIVKQLGVSHMLTESGFFVGKVRYASPEQFEGSEGEQPIDGRSDLYSFGLVLYELLTGTFPIPGDSYSAILAGHLLSEPLSFEISDPENRVPEALRAAVLRALAKRPEERFLHASAFAAELKKIQASWVETEDNPDNLQQTLVFLKSCSKKDDERPGSTQGRLDITFPRDVTPTLAPAGTFDLGSSAKRRKIEPLLGIAERLADRGRIEEAIAQLDAVLGLDPSNDRARILRKALAAGQPRLTSPDHAVVLAEAVRAIDALLDDLQLEEAATALRLAEEAFPDAQALAEQRQRLARFEQEAQQEALRWMLADAHKALEAEKYERARVLAQQAVESEKENAEARRLLAAAEKGLEEERAAAARQAEAKALCEEATGLEADERYAAALDKLQTAQSLTPSDDAIGTRIAATEENLHRQEQRAVALAAVREEVTGLLDEGRLTVAAKALDEAAIAFPEEVSLSALRTRLAELEAAARQRWIEEHLTAARQALDEEAFVRAAASARKALELDAENGRAKEILAAVAAALRLAKQAAARREQSAALIEEATALTAEERFEAALDRLTKAEKLDPDNPDIRRWRSEVEASQRAKEARVKALSEACGEIRVFLDENQLDEAEAAIVAAAQRFPDADPISTLERRLLSMKVEARRNMVAKLLADARQHLASGDDPGRAMSLARRALALEPSSTDAKAIVNDANKALRRREKEEEKRRKRVEGLIRKARKLLSRERNDDALKLLRQAHELDNAHQELQQLLGDIEVKVAQEREQERQHQHLESLAASIEAQLVGGELEAGERALAEAEAEMPNAAPLALLRRRLPELRARARQREIKRLLREGRRALSQRAYSQAVAAADRVLALDRNNEEAEALRLTALEQQRRQAQEEAKRSSGVAMLLERARTLIAENKLDVALERLRDAAQLAPDHPDVVRLLAETEKARKASSKDQQRGMALVRTCRRIESLLDVGHLEEGEKALLAAEASFGKAEESLLVVRRRFESLREQVRQEGVRSRLAAARRAVEAEDLERGAALAAEAMELEAGHPEAQAILDEIDQIRQRWSEAEARRRHRRVAALVQRAESLCAENQLEVALQRLREALQLVPGDEGIAEQITRLEKKLQ